jgi:hypothetical protein
VTGVPEPDRRAIIDQARAADLADGGPPGHRLAIAIRDDGEELYWIVCDAELDAARPRFGNADQPHEQLGPLPAMWRHRVALAPLRCRRTTTRTGRPCRILVSRPGDACSWHRDTSHFRRKERA